MKIISCLFLFLTACIHEHRYIGRDMTPSESPCIDGTLVNMDGAGCKMYYFGNHPDDYYIKMRCTFSKSDSIWTNGSFVAVAGGAVDKTSFEISEDWKLHCADRHVIMFVNFEK